MISGRRIDTLAWLLTCCALSVFTDELRAGTLYLVNGDFIPGEPASPEKPGELLWDSPLFEQPIGFRLEGVQAIRFAGDDIRPVTEGRVTLVDGRELAGRVVGVSEAAIAFDSVRHGRLRIRRSHVRRVENLSADSSLLVEAATGLEGWKTIGRGHRLRDWTFRRGRAATRRRGASILSSVTGDRFTRVELTLSTTEEQLGFQLTLGADDDPAKLREGYSIELLWGRLIAHRQAGERLVSTPLAELEGPRVELVLLFDAVGGTLTVFTGARRLGSLRDPEQTPGILRGIFLRNSGKQLTIERLQVRSYSSPRSLPTPPGGQALLELADGRRVQSTAPISVDDQGRLLVHGEDGEGQRTVPASEIDLWYPARVGESASVEPAPPPGAVGQLEVHGVWADGSVLRGHLVGAAEGGLEVRCDFALDPVLFGYEGARALSIPRASAAAPVDPRAQGSISGATHRLHGSFSGAADAESGFRWRPAFSDDIVSVALDVDSDAPLSGTGAVSGSEVLFDGGGAPAAVSDDSTLSDRLYLTNGDVLPVRLLAWNDEVAEVEVFGERRQVETAFVRALRFNAVSSTLWSQQSLPKKPADDSSGIPEIAGGATAWRSKGAVSQREELLLPLGRGTVGALLRLPESLRVRFTAHLDWEEGSFYVLLGARDPSQGGVRSTDAAGQFRFTVSNRQLTVEPTNVSGDRAVEVGQVSIGASRAVSIEIHCDRQAGLARVWVDGVLCSSVRRAGFVVASAGFWLSTLQPNEDFVEILGRNGFRGGLFIEPPPGREQPAEEDPENPRILRVRGLSLESWPSLLGDAEMRRLLTRPRGVDADEVGYLLRARNGDSVRGGELRVGADEVSVNAGRVPLRIAREQLFEIIHIAGEPDPTDRAPIEAELRGGCSIRLSSLHEVEGELRANAPHLGDFRLPAEELQRVRFGGDPSRRVGELDGWILREPSPLPDG